VQPRVRVLPGIPRPDAVALLDRILRGPAYIAIVFVLLSGIVFFNVDVLELNHGIASTGVRATQLERQNAALTTQLAQLASSERIQSLAIQRGLVLPEPGDVRYLRATPGDPTHALHIMTAPGTGTVTQGATAQPTLVTQSSQPANQPPGTQPMTTPATTAPGAAPTPTTAPGATTTQPAPTQQTQTAPATAQPAQTTP
jgi:cell division protein FtsL